MHRERATDFWVSLATVVALFAPIWGVLLQPSGLIRLPLYLLYLGLPALAVVVGALVYGARRNRVLLNRFLVGYAAGAIGTLAITLLMVLGERAMAMPSIVVALGNRVLGRPPSAPASAAVVAVGTLYHFGLNGAAWGAAYALLFGKVPWWQGILFGFFVWAVLVLSPPFYAWGFPAMAPGPLALALLLLAHFAYGGLVGLLVYRWVFPEVGMEGMKAVRPLYA
ncbi:MAG: hypothetical protein HY321_04825 [Armatimonadetes bacterium]|nr:hypothetical protein [Armatimonadota bacterium]